MALTSDQIAEILNSLGQTRAGTSLEKRRRAIRVKHRDIIKIIPYVEGLPRREQPALLADFSSRGVALRFAHRIPAGSQFVLILQRDNRTPLHLLCEAVHSRHRPDGLYAIGAEFIGLAPNDAPVRNGKADADEASRIAGSILG